MQNFMRQLKLVGVGCSLVLLGCAAEPVVVAPEPAPEPILSGEQMLRESQGIASLGDRWKKGKQLIDQGNVLVSEGRNKIAEGNRLIVEGERIQRESEESYKNIKH